MYVHIHVRVRQLSPQFELLNCAEFRPAGFSLARVRFDFSKVSNMEFRNWGMIPQFLPFRGLPLNEVGGCACRRKTMQAAESARQPYIGPAQF